jgi:AcrR family transcriptional regulator
MVVTKAQAKPKKATSRISSAERRESILAAATEVFIRCGYAGARTKDIAVEAKINEALIYRHFASKEELFDAAVIEPLESWLETYNHAGRLVATAADAETQLQLLERGAEQYLSHMDEVFPLLGIALFGSGSYGPEFYAKRIVPLIEGWARRTATAMPSDAPGSKLDQHFLAIAGIGISFFVAANAHFRGTRLDTEASAKQLAQMMLPLFEHRGDSADRKPD